MQHKDATEGRAWNGFTTIAGVCGFSAIPCLDRGIRAIPAFFSLPACDVFHDERNEHTACTGKKSDREDK